MMQETKQFDRQTAQSARIERTRQRKIEQGLLPSPEDWVRLSFSHSLYERDEKKKGVSQVEQEANDKKLQALFARRTNERVRVDEVAEIAGTRFDSIIGSLTDPNFTPHNNYEDKTTAAVLCIPLGGMKEKPTLAQQAVIEFVREFGGAGVLSGVPKKDWERTIRPELVNLAGQRIALRQESNGTAKR